MNTDIPHQKASNDSSASDTGLLLLDLLPPGLEWRQAMPGDTYPEFRTWYMKAFAEAIGELPLPTRFFPLC